MSIKKISKGLRKIMVWTGAGILVSAILLLMGASINEQKQLEVRSVVININHETGNFFIDEADVSRITQTFHGDLLQGSMVQDLNLKGMEEILRDDPYVAEANMYTDIKGTLFIDVIQRKPIARVINSNRVSYYIGSFGEKMPSSAKFTARVPVCSGHINDNGLSTGLIDSTIVEGLYKLSSFIHQDEFWTAQIMQIYVTPEQEFELIPRLGEHRIIFGGAEDIEEKFDKLMLFYKEGLRNVGWGKYKSINLKYHDQVVCTK